MKTEIKILRMTRIRILTHSEGRPNGKRLRLELRTD